jgi:hypothetical protein
VSGILGSGLMGSKLGTIFARTGYEVVSNYARGELKLEMLGRGAKGKARAGRDREYTRLTADPFSFPGISFRHGPDGRVSARDRW